MRCGQRFFNYLVFERLARLLIAKFDLYAGMSDLNSSPIGSAKKFRQGDSRFTFVILK